MYSANRRQGVGVGSVGSIGSIGEGICGCIDVYLVFRLRRKTAARSHPAAEGCSARESSPAFSAGCGLRLFPSFFSPLPSVLLLSPLLCPSPSFIPFLHVRPSPPPHLHPPFIPILRPLFPPLPLLSPLRRLRHRKHRLVMQYNI